VQVEEPDVEVRHWVLCTPTHGDQCELRVATSAKLIGSRGMIKRLWAMTPRIAATKLIQRAAFHEFCEDLSQDFDIWENKRYVDPPMLAKGDGPVGRYRKWCRQFYAQVPVIRQAV